MGFLPAFALPGLILKEDESLGQHLIGAACTAYFLLPKATVKSFYLELAHVIKQMGPIHLAASGARPATVWTECVSLFL